MVQHRPLLKTFPLYYKYRPFNRYNNFLIWEIKGRWLDSINHWIITLEGIKFPPITYFYFPPLKLTWEKCLICLGKSIVVMMMSDIV